MTFNLTFFEVNRLRKKIEKWLASLDIGKIFTEYFLLTIGSVILAVNFDLFLAPFNIAPGGISGSAIIIHKLKPASPTARCIYLLMEAVSRVLMDRLGVGVTGWAGKGMFSQGHQTKGGMLRKSTRMVGNE